MKFPHDSQDLRWEPRGDNPVSRIENANIPANSPRSVNTRVNNPLRQKENPAQTLCCVPQIPEDTGPNRRVV